MLLVDRGDQQHYPAKEGHSKKYYPKLAPIPRILLSRGCMLKPYMHFVHIPLFLQDALMNLMSEDLDAKEGLYDPFIP